jgi:ATP/maltotriose-dependent transcriptional regulator MalT
MRGTMIAAVAALCGMIISRKLLLPLSAAVLGASILPNTSHAQSASDQPIEKLAAAFRLDTAGNPAQAIAEVDKLLASGALSRTQQADALDLEGICYHEMDQPDKALHAFDAALQLLAPGDTGLRASILDNLGRVYVSRGDRAVAERLYRRAFWLFETAGDHGGMVRVMNNRAFIALSEKKDRQAREYLKWSDREMELAKDLDNDDLAALMSMHGWLALNEHDTRAAVEAYRRALQLWVEFHGEQHPLTAWGTFILGQAEALNGQWREGAQTIEKGLALTRATMGDRSLRYLRGEIAYARVLDQMGESARAAQLRLDARTKQASVTGETCRNCRISVTALR